MINLVIQIIEDKPNALIVKISHEDTEEHTEIEALAASKIVNFVVDQLKQSNQFLAHKQAMEIASKIGK